MEECTNIDNEIINHIILKDDGTVNGFFTNDDLSTPDGPNITNIEGNPLDESCCEFYGYTYNSDICKCTWQTSCLNDGVKLYLNPLENNSVLFTYNEDTETKLIVSLDILIEFDSNDIISLDSSEYINIFNGLNLNSSIELEELKPVLDGIVYESPFSYQSVISENILHITEFGDYIENNPITGIRLVGDYIDEITNGIKNSIPGYIGYFNDKTFNSDWLNHSFEVNDISILNTLKGKRIKLGVMVSDTPIEFSIYFDNIKLLKSDDIINNVSKEVIKCPGFELNRVVDNKKSWVSGVLNDARLYTLEDRETNYISYDDKLNINTKEIDLSIDPSLAIEGSLYEYLKNNEDCLLGSLCGDYSDILNTNVDNIISVNNFNEVFKSEFVDVKNRKVIDRYGTMRTIYDGYLDPSQCCGGTCPEGYEFNPKGDGCIFIDQQDPTYETSATILKSRPLSILGEQGTIFYEDVSNGSFPITKTASTSNAIYDDGTEVGIMSAVTGTEFWGKPTGLNGRLNNIGVYDGTFDQFSINGFSVCLDFEEDVTYFIGLSADKTGRFYVNSELIVEVNDIRHWLVFPFTFSSGKNIIQMEAENLTGGYSFGFEIYSAETIESLYTATTESEADIYWNTLEKVSDEFDFGNGLGYSCPEDYSIDTCGDPVMCTKILRSDLINCVDNGCPESSKFNYSDMIKLTEKVNNNWVNLVEQVVPSTTIWDSTYKYRNTVFDDNKFKYREYNLVIGDDLDLYNTPLSSQTVEIKTEMIYGTGVDTYNSAHVINMNSGSEFIGTVDINNTNILISD